MQNVNVEEIIICNSDADKTELSKDLSGNYLVDFGTSNTSTLLYFKVAFSVSPPGSTNFSCTFYAVNKNTTLYALADRDGYGYSTLKYPGTKIYTQPHIYFPFRIKLVNPTTNIACSIAINTQADGGSPTPARRVHIKKR